MKDKVFFPSIVLTMVFLIVFMLICIKTQTSMTKELSVRLEKTQAEITKIQKIPIPVPIPEPIPEPIQDSIQESMLSVLKESEKLRAEIVVMKNQIRELKKEIDKAKSEVIPDVPKKRKK